MAREMHDSVAKTLYGLALAAEALAASSEDADPQALKRQATAVADAARLAAAESRKLLTDLRRHSDLTDPDIDLLPELRCMAADFEARTDLAPAVRHRGAPAVLPSAAAHHVLAIVSEALENAHRHADANAVTVELGVSENEFALLVRDDGVGLPAPATPAAIAAWTRSGHFGLLGMTERAACVGGHIRLDRSPGGGTEVRLTLPLSTAALPAPPTSQEEAAHA